MSRRNGLFIAALGGLALVFCGAQAPSEKPKAGQPVQHNAKDSQSAAAKPDAQKQEPSPPAVQSKLPEAEAATEAKGHRGDEKGNERPKWTDVAQAASALIVMLFTGFLAWLSWRQHKLEERLAEETGESIEIAKSSADAAQAAANAMQAGLNLTIAQLRAYVAVTKVWLKVETHDGPFIGQVSIKNVGQTPARKVNVRGAIRYVPFPLVESAMNLPPITNEAEIIMPPGEEGGLEPPLPKALTKAEMATLYAGTHAIAIWGQIDYIDFTGARRETPFRYFLGGDFGVRPGFPLCPHERGNDAT